MKATLHLAKPRSESRQQQAGASMLALQTIHIEIGTNSGLQKISLAAPAIHWKRAPRRMP
jgi:hypothetical protein